MKMVFKSAAICAALLLTACGGGGGDESKDLFSVWTRDGDGATIDLTALTLAAPGGFSFFDRDGSQCNCVVTFIGTQEQGNVAVNQCYYVRGSSSKDPGCTARNGLSNYTNISSVLTLTNGQGSFVFR